MIVPPGQRGHLDPLGGARSMTPFGDEPSAPVAGRPVLSGTIRDAMQAGLIPAGSQ